MTSPPGPIAPAEESRRADLVLRCAWLRGQAWEMERDVDPTGFLSAQLRDFADLLEACDREGRWTR